jgi:hypothetical protein
MFWHSFDVKVAILDNLNCNSRSIYKCLVVREHCSNLFYTVISLLYLPYYRRKQKKTHYSVVFWTHITFMIFIITYTCLVRFSSAYFLLTRKKGKIRRTIFLLWQDSISDDSSELVNWKIIIFIAIEIEKKRKEIFWKSFINSTICGIRRHRLKPNYRVFLRFKQVEGDN